MEKQQFHVRTALMPICYKDFHCLAAACRDNCCGGWEIAFSKKDYLRIKRSAKSEELREILSEGMSRLRKVQIEDFYAHFNVGAEGTCAFQTEEGLCRLQLECGEEVLPKVCRSYPRRDVYTPAAREFSISPSCEGVLALLWDLPQGIDFWEEPLPKADWRVVKTEGGVCWFPDIRSFCIDVLQERSLPLSRRMLLLGVLLQRLRDLDWDAEGAVEDWLAWGESQLHDPAAASVLEGMPRDRLGFLTGNIRVLVDLYGSAAAKNKDVHRSLFSALSAEENWEKEDGSLGQFSMDTDRYQKLERQLEELLDHSDYFFENLMVMTAFYLTFPVSVSPEKLWRSYAELCGLYSFYRFAAVLSCYQEVSRERLFQVIGTVSRGLLHNAGRRNMLLDEMFEKGNSTLVHMAILAGG